MSKQQATFDDFFSECYLKYREHIKNYIALRICRPYEAEDLAQDVFCPLVGIQNVCKTRHCLVFAFYDCP